MAVGTARRCCRQQERCRLHFLSGVKRRKTGALQGGDCLLCSPASRISYQCCFWQVRLWRHFSGLPKAGQNFRSRLSAFNSFWWIAVFSHYPDQHVTKTPLSLWQTAPSCWWAEGCTSPFCGRWERGTHLLLLLPVWLLPTPPAPLCLRSGGLKARSRKEQWHFFSASAELRMFLPNCQSWYLHINGSL